MADVHEGPYDPPPGEPPRRRATRQPTARLRRAGMFETVPHLIPDGDHFVHDDAPGCPCGPLLESGFAPSLGGAAWYRHRLIEPEPLDDVFPAEWAAS